MDGKMTSVVRRMENEKADLLKEAGKYALDSLIYYAEPEKVEANKRQALMCYGRFEQTVDTINRLHGAFQDSDHDDLINAK